MSLNNIAIDIIQKIINYKYDVSLNSKLKEDLMIDSLQLLNILVEIEEKLSIEIIEMLPNYVDNQVMTVRELITFISVVGGIPDEKNI